MLLKKKNFIDSSLLVVKLNLSQLFKKGIHIKETEVFHDTNGHQYDWASERNLVKMPLWPCATSFSFTDQAPHWVTWWETQMMIELGFTFKSFTGKKQLYQVQFQISQGRTKIGPVRIGYPILDQPTVAKD